MATALLFSTTVVITNRRRGHRPAIITTATITNHRCGRHHYQLPRTSPLPTVAAIITAKIADQFYTQLPTILYSHLYGTINNLTDTTITTVVF